MVITRLAIAAGREAFQDRCARLNKQMLADRGSDQRLNDWLVGSVATVSTGEEADTA
jgi:hypothetical protein